MIALRAILRRPLRSALAAAGVAAAVATYLLVVGSARGLVRQYHETAAFLGADVVVQQAGATSVWSSSLSPDDVAALRGVPGAAGTSRVALGKTRLVGAPYFLVFGLDPGEALLPRVPLRSGRRPRQGEDGILLGAHAAARLRADEGSTLDVRGRSFRVTGTYATGLSALDAGGVVDLDAARTLFDRGASVQVVFLHLSPGADAVALAAAITRSRPRLDAVLAGRWSSSFGHVELIEGFARFLAVLGVLLSALGTAVVVQTTVAERVVEIAVLRAVGWSRARVGRLLLAETALVSLAGFAAGALLSESVLLAARSGSLGYAASFLPSHVTPRLLAEALVVAAVAGLGGLASLAGLARTAPARALRAA